MSCLPVRILSTGPARCWDALDGYLNDGGRLMYLGGNGFYWVTAVDPEDPGQIEVRRFTGTRSWQAEPASSRSA